MFRGIGGIKKRKERFLAVVVGEEGKERAMGRGEEMNAWLLRHRHQHHLHRRHILKCDNCGAPLVASVFFSQFCEVCALPIIHKRT